jgi:hypothetical protein
VFSTIDREYKYIQEQANQPTGKQKELSPKQKEFKVTLEKNGYSFMDNRDTNETFNAQMTGAEIGNLVKAYLAYKDIAIKKKKWIDQGLKDKRSALDRVKRIARAGMISFMN